MQLILQAEADQTLPRTITIPQGKAKIELHFEYQEIDITQAATLVDQHDEAVKATSEQPTESELVALRQGYLTNVLSTYLKKWDVQGVEEGKKTVLEINTTNIEAVLKKGVVFWAIYNDWLDLITEISQGQSKTKRDAELKKLNELGYVWAKEGLTPKADTQRDSNDLFNSPAALELKSYGLSDDAILEQLQKVMTPSNRQIVARFSVIKPLFWLLKHSACMRYAPFGVIGFDYVQLEAVMRLEAVPRSERSTLFERVKAFESGMLKGFAEKQAVKTRQGGH